MKSFCKTIKKVENKNVSASEVAEEADLLVDTINRRKEENFQTTQITTLISKLENEGLMTESEYLQSVNLFYDTFKLVQLKTPPHRIWRLVVKTHFQEVSCTDLYNLLQQKCVCVCARARACV
jgi:broad-specificity NMP kinase